MESPQELERLEAALVQAGRILAPAQTPDYSTRVVALLEQERSIPMGGTLFGGFRIRWAWVAFAAVLLSLALVLAFPDTREALAQLLGLRTIRIVPATPTLTATATLPRVPSATTGAGLATAPAGTPTRSVTPSSLTQCCETTLGDAQMRSQFKLLLPPTPAPSRVYFQELADFGGAEQVILVFGNPSAPEFTLYEATDFLYGKIISGGTVIEETQVRGQRALWLTGAPHLLVVLDANGRPQWESDRTVNVNTLAWEVGNVTYRVETNRSKEAAIRFAESLQ